MSIAQRITALIVTTLALLAGVIVASFSLLNHMHEQVSILNGNIIPSLEIINGAALKLSSIRANSLRYMLARDEAERQDLTRKLVFLRQALDRDLTRYESEYVMDNREKALLQRVRKAIAAFDNRQEGVRAASVQLTEAGGAILMDAQAALGEVSEAMRHHHDYNIELAANAAAESRRDLQVGLAVLGGVTLLCAVLLTVFGYRTRCAFDEMLGRLRKSLRDLRDHASTMSAAAADLSLVSRSLSEASDRQSIDSGHMGEAADDLQVRLPGLRDHVADAREQVTRLSMRTAEIKGVLGDLSRYVGGSSDDRASELAKEAAAVVVKLEADVVRSGAVVAALGGVIEAYCQTTGGLVLQVSRVARMSVENSSIAASALASAVSLASVARAMNDEVGRCAA